MTRDINEAVGRLVNRFGETVDINNYSESVDSDGYTSGSYSASQTGVTAQVDVSPGGDPVTTPGGQEVEPDATVHFDESELTASIDEASDQVARPTQIDATDTSETYEVLSVARPRDGTLVCRCREV